MLRRSKAANSRRPRTKLAPAAALCALLLGILAGDLSAQQAPYVDPALRAFQQAAAATDSAPAGIAQRRVTMPGAPRVGVFARIRDERAIALLGDLGATIGARYGRLLSAEVPATALPTLTSSSAFEMIEAARTVAFTHDSSMKAIRADLVRQPVAGGWTGSAGQGVVVAIYDTGLDFTHPDFLDENGQTRVLALWDQTQVDGPAPPGSNYGRLCTREEIQQVVNNPLNPLPCPQADFNGHGTHVAGSAAGDGSAVGNGSVAPFTFAGVAPLADLMIVKGGNGFFSETMIMDGLRWLERQARALNRPMVVNLSLGGQTGPHDGSRIYEQLIDSISRPGFVVVIAATNDGENGNDKNEDGSEPLRTLQLIHGSGLPGVTRDFTFEIRPYAAQTGACNDMAIFSLWYEAGDRLAITIVRPDGSVVTAGFGQLVDEDGVAGNVRIDNASAGMPNPNNNAYEADIRVSDCGPTGTPPLNGTWTLRVQTVTAGSGRPYHFWLYSQSVGGSGSNVRGRTGFDNRFMVGSPGNAKSAITVGAFVTRLCWPSPAKPEGPVCFTTQEQIGDIARWSAPGPTRDGRLKPEITAPGIAIASALSRHSGPAANRILSDGVHTINQGTSMAAPHVTGAIAALLQHDPLLDAAAIRDLFERTAQRDAFTSRTYANSPEGRPTDWWGFGKLNVCAAVGSLTSTGSAASAPIAIQPAADTLPINATTRFFTCSPASAAITFASTNPAVATVDELGVVRAAGVGEARIIVSSGSFADTAVVVVTPPARVHFAAHSAVPQEPTLGARGTMLPLLAAEFHTTGHEAVQITALTFRVVNPDPQAQLALIVDLNRNSRIDVGERVLARAALQTGVVEQLLTIDSLTVARNDSIQLLVAVELSGRAPNGATFRASMVPERVRTRGVRSSVPDQVGDGVVNASADAMVTLLEAGSIFSLSENPVRSGRVVFNFSERPKVAAVYSLNGRRVLDLLPRLSTDGSVDWNLRNEAGERVASGVYFVVFDVGGRIVREKLFVLGGAQ